MTRQEITFYILIGLLLLIMAAGGYIIEQQDKKALKAEERRMRRINDTDKQLATDMLAQEYEQLLLKEIMK